jgi:hypothetical protein
MSTTNIPVASFILPNTYTVDTLPDPSNYVDMYARVSDLFGSKRDLVLASQVGSTSFWQPVRQDYGATKTITADFTVFPLKSPNALKLTGSIGVGATRNVTLSTVGGWPGATFEVNAGLTSLLGALNILGTGLGSGVGLLLGSYQKYFLDISSGSLQWVRIL